MTIRLLSTSLVAAGSLVTWLAAPAAAQCCADHRAQAMPACCATHGHDDAATAAAHSGLLPMPAVQTAVVTFRDPVRVGDTLLFGRYVIEHDNDRMARGEPCTYIYEAGNRRMPVVTFHCTHLEGPAPATDTVVLRRSPVYPVQELRSFQFAGDPAGHGVPAH